MGNYFQNKPGIFVLEPSKTAINILKVFQEQKIKKIADGFNVINIESFEIVTLPRKLFRVILKKK